MKIEFTKKELKIINTAIFFRIMDLNDWKEVTRCKEGIILLSLVERKINKTLGVKGRKNRKLLHL